MSTLLPPNVIGPVSVLSREVRIDGPLPGSSVDLLINGVSNGSVNVGSTTTFVPIVAGTLKTGDQLTARWSLGGETSDPSPVPVVVIGLPPKLSPLAYLSQIHECVDWILLGGAYPGATVEVFNGGTPIGRATAQGNVVAVEIRGTINSNDTLEAIQSILTPTGTVKGPPTPSLPAEPTPFRENTMPAPSIGPVPGCAQAVPIMGIAQGASTHLSYNADILSYPFVGTALWALLGRDAHRPDTFTATQHFKRCNASSPPSAPAVVVDDTLPVRKPSIGSGKCPSARAILISNLEPGAVLTIQLVQPSGGTTVLGRIGVGQGVNAAQFWIPDLSSQIPAAPPYPSLVVVQEHCGKTATSDKALFVGTFQGSIFPPTVMEPLVECASGVYVNSVHGAVVRLYSDALDSPIISSPVYDDGGLVWIDTVRPLRAGEHIHAELELSCQPPQLRIGPAVRVAELTTLRAPKIVEPIRVFHRTVFITGVTTGANVHVFVNEKWRAHVLVKHSFTTFLAVDVGALKVEDKVTALQALCTKMSRKTTPPVNVTPGRMQLSAQPPSLVQGQADSLTIKAVDVDNTTRPVAATVSHAGSVIGATNAPFTLSPPAGQPTVNLAVSAAGYSTETITIPLTAPTVVKPAMLTIATGLWFNASKKVIKEITWNLLGPATSFSKTEKPNADPALVQFALPKPVGGGITPFTLSCEVTFEFENFNFISGASGIRSSNYIEGGLIKPSPSTVEMHWNGTDMTINFLVRWIPEIDFFVIKSM